MDENIKMVKAIRDNQIEQRSIEDSIIHEIAHIRREMATKEDIIHIHHRLDYQISRIARTEEELHFKDEGCGQKYDFLYRVYTSRYHSNGVRKSCQANQHLQS